MATAGDRLQIVLTAKDEISAQLKQTKAEMTSLGRTAATLQNRMENGEQGLQNEYEQTRRALEKNRLEQIKLGRSAAEARSDIRKMTTDGTAGAKRMDRSFDSLGRSMDKTHRSTMTLSGGWGKMLGVVAGVTTAIAAMSTAFRFLGDSVNEARDARKAIAQTAAVLKSMSRTESSDALTKMIDGMEALSGIDGDEIRVITNTLLTFGNVSGPVFKQANQAALDVSAAFDKGLQPAAVMVGKALNDPIKGLTALTRIGVSFTDEQVEQVKAMMAVGDIAGAQKIIMAELSRETAGSAAAQSDSIGRMQVAWDNLKEAIGESLMASSPGWDVVGAIQTATKWIVKNRGQIKETLLTIAAGAMRVGQAFLLMSALTVNAIGGMLTVLEPLWQAMAISGIPVISDMGEALKGSGAKSTKAANQMFTFSEKLGVMADKSFAARDELRRLNDLMKNVHGPKRIKFVIETVVKGFTDLGDIGMDVAAMGGPVSGPTLVGELGPELFVPTIGSPQVIGADGPEIRDFRASGTVIPNHLLATVTLPAQKQPAGYVGPPVQIGTINATRDIDVEAAVLRATLRADRIARERR